MSFSGVMYLLGIIGLIPVPFTGITVVTASAYFIIGWTTDN